MIKRTIKWEDYDGNQREEDFYFNLTKTELSKYQMSHDGGVSSMRKRIVDAQSTSELVKVFTEFVDMSYGVKSDDGKYFKKSPEILEEFKSTGAYDQLFMDLLLDTKRAYTFINGIMPSDIAGKLNEDENIKKMLADNIEKESK